MMFNFKFFCVFFVQCCKRDFLQNYQHFNFQTIKKMAKKNHFFNNYNNFNRYFCRIIEKC